MPSNNCRNSPVLIGFSGVANRDQFNWLRLAGLEAPLLIEHAELVIEQTQQIWHTYPATPRQQRFLRLRDRWVEGLTQERAFRLIEEQAVLEQQELAFGRPSWDRLVELEPRLADLPVAAKECQADTSCTWEECWFGKRGLHARMCRLVGYGAEQPGLLASPAAYEIAYSKLVAAMR